MSWKYKKCNFIVCGKINKYAFLVLLEAGLNISAYFVMMQSKSLKYPIWNPAIIQIVMALGSILSFILIIIYHLINKRKNNTIEMPLVRKDTTNERSWKKKILWILLVPIFNFLNIFIDGFIGYIGVNYLNMFAFYFLFLSLFSILLLKNKLYNHHYVSIIIILIFDLVNSILYNVSIINPFPASKLSYLPIMFNQLFYCLLLVYYKYLMMNKYIKTYEILFFEGLFTSVLLIIAYIILLKIKYSNFFWLYYQNIDTKEIFILIILALMGFFFSLVKLIIIDIFSPSYILITELIPRNLSNIFGPSDIKKYITTSVFTVLYLFIFFIFVEFIELNFLGLNKMTKRNIEIRAGLENIDDEDINDLNNKKRITLDEYGLELEFKNDQAYDENRGSRVSRVSY